MNYYRKELAKLGIVEGHETAAKVQITSEDGKTNWLDLNPESIPELIEFLAKLQTALVWKEKNSGKN